MVEDYSEVGLISTQWMHCVNSSNHFLMPSLSLIPFVGVPDKVLEKVHILDLSFWVGCIVGNEEEGCEVCRLVSLLGHSGFLAFFECDVLFSIKMDSDGLDSWIQANDVKLRQSPTCLIGPNNSEILVSLHLVKLILEHSHGLVIL